MDWETIKIMVILFLSGLLALSFYFEKDSF